MNIFLANTMVLGTEKYIRKLNEKFSILFRLINYRSLIKLHLSKMLYIIFITEYLLLYNFHY